MRVYIGSDHGGFQLKNDIKTYLEGKEDYKSGESTVLDLGVFTDDRADYPDIAREVGEKVRENARDKGGSLGILICGTGVGMAIAANKMKDIRAALAWTEYVARMARRDDDANILCLAGRVTGVELAKAIVDAFLVSEFNTEHPRYQRRKDKVAKIYRDELNKKLK